MLQFKQLARRRGGMDFSSFSVWGGPSSTRLQLQFPNCEHLWARLYRNTKPGNIARALSYNKISTVTHVFILAACRHFYLCPKILQALPSSTKGSACPLPLLVELHSSSSGTAADGRDSLPQLSINLVFLWLVRITEVSYRCHRKHLISNISILHIKL